MPNVPISWLKDHVEVLPGTDARTLAQALVKVGLEEEEIHPAQVTGPLVVGKVLTLDAKKQTNGKVINYCRVDVGTHNDPPGTGKEPSELPSRGIICGAHNFGVGDYVVVSLPGAILPGEFKISARKTYGHISDGMICSERELGLGTDHDGIIVLNKQHAKEDIPPIGEDVIEFLGLGQELLEINVTPDRGYCFSMRGVAREYAHSTGAHFTDPGLATTPEANEKGFPVEVEDDEPLRDHVGCNRFVTRVVRGVDPQAPTPRWMVERLEAMGMRSVSLAVDITNYVMLDLGQPLHAYDLSDLAGPLVVRRAHPGESLRTLDDVERNLDPEDLLITDSPDGKRASRILGLAGVMGGQYSEVEESTTDVLIEAAHFDAVSVARSARRHFLHSEASKRFERGTDPLLPPVAADMAARLLAKYGNGSVDHGVFDLNFVPDPELIIMPVMEPQRLTGVAYPPERVVELLEEIGAQVEGDDPLQVTVPSWRPDLKQPCDLVEEIARLDGYDNIPSELPQARAGQGVPPRMMMRRRTQHLLADLGFVGVGSYPFIGDAHDLQLIPDDDERRQAIELRNPLVEARPKLRTNVLDSLLDVARRNRARGAESIRVFEMGMVARPQGVVPHDIPSAQQRPHPKEVGGLHRGTPKQPWHLGVVAGGRAQGGDLERDYDWKDATELVQELGRELGVTIQISALYRQPGGQLPHGRPTPKPLQDPAYAAPWHPGRSGILFVSQKKRIVSIGRVGELHPRVIDAYALPARSIALELDLEALFKLIPDTPVEPHAISSYPPVKEDIAIVLDQQIPVSMVLDTIRSAGGPLLEDVSLFDEYVGDQIEEGKRSLAFALRMRATDRTLKAKEAAKVRGEIVDKLSNQLGAKLRA